MCWKCLCHIRNIKGLGWNLTPAAKFFYRSSIHIAEASDIPNVLWPNIFMSKNAENIGYLRVCRLHFQTHHRSWYPCRTTRPVFKQKGRVENFTHSLKIRNNVMGKYFWYSVKNSVLWAWNKYLGNHMMRDSRAGLMENLPEFKYLRKFWCAFVWKGNPCDTSESFMSSSVFKTGLVIINEFMKKNICRSIEIKSHLMGMFSWDDMVVDLWCIHTAQKRDRDRHQRKYTEPHGNLCCHLSFCSMNVSIQS